MKLTTKVILDWLSRNVVIVAMTVLIIAFLGAPRFVIDTIAVGAAVVTISVILAHIVIYSLTKFKFLESLDLGLEPSEVSAAKIGFNAILRLCVVIIYGATAIAVAISIFIAQWRIGDVPAN